MVRKNLPLVLLATLLLTSAACDDESGRGGGTTNGANNGPMNNGNNGTGGGNNGASNNGAGTNNGTSVGTNNGAGDCPDGERRCTDAGEVGECQGGQLVAVEACSGGQVCSSGRCVNTESCEPGEVDGCWGEAERRVCNAEGTAFAAEPCADGLRCFDGQCTDQLCRPGVQHCLDPDTIEVCNEAGDAYVDQQACPDGSVCLEGACLSGCDLSEKFPSYIGCQYWSLDLDNWPDPFGRPDMVPHAVVVSNPSAMEATVSVTTMAQITLDPTTFTVPPGGVEVYTFPVLNVDGTGLSFNSFFLESSWPVVAYQFNPLNNVGVASNDGSLLLPAEFLGTEYIAMTWPSSPVPFGTQGPQHGYVTIVATRPGNTEVTVIPTADVEAGPNIPYLIAGEIYQFTLRRYEVLNLEADASDLMLPFMTDLTGTIITADQPIAVFGGHEEAVVSPARVDEPQFPTNNEEDGSCCAEHLEEQLFPVSTWGTRYLAVRSEPRGGSKDVWRILAAQNGTVVQTTPPQPDAASETLNRGEYVTFETEESFEVIADKPVMVGQYLASQERTVDYTGDPAFILSVPIDQLRDNYTVLTPADYAEDWLTIIRPAGVAITLDGNLVPDTSFSTFGSGDYEYAWVQVEDGAHTVEGDEPFALVAHGYSNVVSYGYPAGLDLRVRD